MERHKGVIYFKVESSGHNGGVNCPRFFFRSSFVNRRHAWDENGSENRIPDGQFTSI